MPIENELKFVLSNPNNLYNFFSYEYTMANITQAYLDGSVRIRRKTMIGKDSEYFFTYKTLLHDDSNLEIECQITQSDFNSLFQKANRVLNKSRASFEDGPYHWDIDFFPGKDCSIIFAMAEVEMPAGQVDTAVHSLISDHVVYAVPKGDKHFTSYALSDSNYLEVLATHYR